jgi:hypothetical protein
VALALNAFSFIKVTDHSVLLNLCGQHMLGEQMGFSPQGVHITVDDAHEE